MNAPRILAVDGPSGAGKSTFAAALVTRMRADGVAAALVSTDDFATWDDPVSWWPRLVDGVLDPLSAGRPGRYQRMEWLDGVPRLGTWVDVPVPDVLVLEGVSAGRASIRPRLSLLYWLPGPDAATRLERAVRREGEGSREHLRSWQRFERGWFAVDATPQHADVTLDPGQ